MTLYEYFFKNTDKKESDKIIIPQTNTTPKVYIHVPLPKKPVERPTTVYVVTDKNANSPIGVFYNLETAKLSGQKKTYHNYMVTPFIINDECKYLSNPIFESN